MHSIQLTRLKCISHHLNRCLAQSSPLPNLDRDRAGKKGGKGDQNRRLKPNRSEEVGNANESAVIRIRTQSELMDRLKQKKKMQQLTLSQNKGNTKTTARPSIGTTVIPDNSQTEPGFQSSDHDEQVFEVLEKKYLKPVLLTHDFFHC